MAKRSRSVSTPVARAPFHRGAYVHQYVQSKAADAFLAEHGESIPLIGAPELGGRRGSNRSEITPAFLYHAVAALTPADPDEPTVVLADGRTLSVSDWEAESADPQIDSVSQHATTAHRDRRLMSAASITRTRYVGPCVERETDEGEKVWQRASTSKAGVLTWHDCPSPCPQGCKVDHRHVRHQHRDAGTLYVHQTMPYGADGQDRTREDGRPISKRQGRRTRRASMGAWADATYTVADPTATATGAYVVVEPSEHTARRTTTLAPSLTASAPVDLSAVDSTSTHAALARPSLPDTDDGLYAVGTGKASEARWVRHPGQTSDTYLVTREVVETPSPWVDHGDVPAVPPATTTLTVLVRSWVKSSREFVTLPAEWARVPFAPTRARGANGRPPTTLAVGMPEATLRHRIAADPASAALAYRVLLAAEHAWASNGQPITADKGLTLTVLPAHGGPTLSITRGDTVVAAGSYKARRSLVRLAVANVLTS